MTGFGVVEGGDGASVVRAVVEAMTMPFAVEVVLEPHGASPSGVEEAIRAFHDDLRWADGVFSLWKPNSPMARLSRGDIGIDECPPAVGEVLAECERYREETNGYFDARRPDGALDPTGIVKTWAVVRASRRLDALDTAGWMIGASGDVMASGVSGTGGPWRVGIADPRHAGSPEGEPVLDVVVLGRGGFTALASSGTAQHGQHIWNPKTGKCEAAFAQASVVGADLVECDAWATAIVAGGQGVALAAQSRGLEVLAIPDDPTGPLRGEASPLWPSVDRT